MRPPEALEAGADGRMLQEFGQKNNDECEHVLAEAASDDGMCKTHATKIHG
jgi:hypothetical protein